MRPNRRPKVAEIAENSAARAERSQEAGQWRGNWLMQMESLERLLEESEVFKAFPGVREDYDWCRRQLADELVVLPDDTQGAQEMESHARAAEESWLKLSSFLEEHGLQVTAPGEQKTSKLPWRRGKSSGADQDTMDYRNQVLKNLAEKELGDPEAEDHIKYVTELIEDIHRAEDFFTNLREQWARYADPETAQEAWEEDRSTVAR